MMKLGELGWKGIYLVVVGLLCYTNNRKNNVIEVLFQKKETNLKLKTDTICLGYIQNFNQFLAYRI